MATEPVLPVDLTKEQPRTLREILFTHPALAGAKALEITEMMAELQPLMRSLGNTQHERSMRVALCRIEELTDERDHDPLLDRIRLLTARALEETKVDRG